VRTWAGNLLALFRVQRIEFVDIDPSKLPDEETLEQAASKLESMMQDQVRIDKEGDLQQVDEATARSLSSMPVRFPSALEDEPRITRTQGNAWFIRPLWRMNHALPCVRVGTRRCRSICRVSVHC
jgi:hypothetical protein